ncbi:MAG: leader peptidase (prepilin peptidase)/N-methyltransferase [Oceanicoccus sp.]|jgi:leader peptidase (prepilin peptidase)/N-methyltransferase
MTLALAIVLGLIFGSFLSMLIPRLHNEEKGIVKGRSHCPKCKKTLTVFELIPVLSYVIQGGKCKHCKKPIAAWYPVIELSTALTFLWMAIRFEAPWEAGLWALLMWVMLYIFFYDLRYKEIHDIVMIPGILTAFAFSFFIGDPLSSLIGGAIGLLFFGTQYVISKGKWLGSGDLLIGAFMGLMLGWQLTLVALFAGYVIGSIIGVGLLATKKANGNTQLPLGPFLVMGSMIAFAWGDLIINWYLGL